MSKDTVVLKFKHHKEYYEIYGASDDIAYARVLIEKGREAMEVKTLRDEIAIAAMQGLISSDVFMNKLDEASSNLGMTGDEERVVHPKTVATIAYQIATAMLKVRGEE